MTRPRRASSALRVTAGVPAALGVWLCCGPAAAQTPVRTEAIGPETTAEELGPPRAPHRRERPEAAAGRPETDPSGFLSPHYDKGFVLVAPRDPDRVPFRLRLNHVSQFKYTNSMNVNSTYVDHLGREREVQRRNDVQLTRDVFYFSGYAFDQRLDYNILIYHSSATLTATAAGYAGYVFDPAFALRAGYFSLPVVRSLTGTYPYFHGTDRSLANNYMRSGFTQGIWINSESLPGFNYIAMVGNSLNTLDIAASNIDSRFAYSGSVWYDHNEFGKPWNDYEYHRDLSLRVGTAFTFAREDRLSDLSEANPENNQTFVSDGNLLFGTGALAPDVTIGLANFWLWAIDAGYKYRGLAFNTELYLRWLNDFEADGRLPIDSMFDWGMEASLGYFVLRSRLEPYLRGSFIRGPFGTGGEGAIGVTWYPFETRGVWLNAELIGIKDSPYTSIYYIYAAGQTGLLIPVQFMLRF